MTIFLGNCALEEAIAQPYICVWEYDSFNEMCINQVWQFDLMPIFLEIMWKMKGSHGNKCLEIKAIAYCQSLIALSRAGILIFVL